MNYIATDNNGKTYLYSDEPVRIGDSWAPQKHSRFIEISSDAAFALTGKHAAGLNKPIISI